jgi:hypothetical protein
LKALQTERLVAPEPQLAAALPASRQNNGFEFSKTLEAIEQEILAMEAQLPSEEKRAA